MFNWLEIKISVFRNVKFSVQIKVISVSAKVVHFGIFYFRADEEDFEPGEFKTKKGDQWEGEDEDDDGLKVSGSDSVVVVVEFCVFWF